MNKDNLKKFITKVLLEKVDTTPNVIGKLVKKSVSFRGIDRQCVCEGTVTDANQYAFENDLSYKLESSSHFGGHYVSEMTSYEFQPNAEFYGDLMESNLSAREQFSRICGTNDQILKEVDAQGSENLVEFICTDKTFREDRTDMVFEKIKSDVNGKMYDKTQFVKLFEYLVKQANLVCENKNLSESELEYATKLLSQRFFKNEIVSPSEMTEAETLCGKKSFKTGNAFENMQRIVSGHQMFL